MAIEGTLATAQQEAYHFLRDQILCGELTGNSRLNPAEIADRLGISRMPVREALRQLDAEGLITMRPNRAAFVSNLSAAEVEELFEIRTVLEVMAVGYAVRNLTEDSLAELIALKDRMDRARHDKFEWVKRHEDFHQAICNIGPRKRLAREVRRIRHAIRPYLLAYMKIFDRVEMPGLEHSSLIDALASRDLKRAEEEMRQHVANPGVGLIEFLRKRDAEALTNPVKNLASAGAVAR
jgi:DNA-binding GntR family transcriptional regulator